jgi:hypothetical protein
MEGTATLKTHAKALSLVFDVRLSRNSPTKDRLGCGYVYFSAG